MRRQEAIHIYDSNCGMIPLVLYGIREEWRARIDAHGDEGSCVIGAGFSFSYNGMAYFMSPPTRFQGSISWEASKDAIQALLEDSGAYDVYYCWGNLD